MVYLGLRELWRGDTVFQAALVIIVNSGKAARVFSPKKLREYSKY